MVHAPSAAGHQPGEFLVEQFPIEGILNGWPPTENAPERTSWVRNELVANKDKVALVRIWECVQSRTTGRVFFAIPMPTREGQEPPIVTMALRKEFGKKATIIPTPKQLMLDAMVLVSRNGWKPFWSTSKWASASNQPIAAGNVERLDKSSVEEAIARGFLVADGNRLFVRADMHDKPWMVGKGNMENGCVHMPLAIHRVMHQFFGVSKLQALLKVTTDGGLKGCLVHDPFSPDPNRVAMWVGNVKGPTKVGWANIPLESFGMVSKSDQYFTLGVRRSDQVTVMTKNWKELSRVPVTEELRLLQAVMRYDPKAMLRAIRLDKKFDIREDGDDELDPDGARIPLVSRVERLLVAGVKEHPAYRDAAPKIAMAMMKRLEKGVFVECGHMAMTAPSAACPPGHVIISRLAWKHMGEPSTIARWRYPVNQPSEIRQYQVIVAGNSEDETPKVPHIPIISGGSTRTVWVHPEDSLNHNEDYDGDLNHMEPTDQFQFQAVDEPHRQMEKGKGRNPASHWEDMYKTHTAGSSVGRICNLGSIIRAIVACRKAKATDLAKLQELQGDANLGYHVAIQSTKNCDADVRGIITRLEMNLEIMNYPTALPWGHAKFAETADGVKDFRDFMKSVSPVNDEGKYTGTNWTGCVQGWKAHNMGRLKTFPQKNFAVDLEKFEKFVAESPVVPDEAAEMLAFDLEQAMGEAIDANRALQQAELRAALAGNRPEAKVKPDFSKVWAIANKLRELERTEPHAREVAAVRLAKNIIRDRGRSTLLFDMVASPWMLAHAHGGHVTPEYERNMRLFYRQEAKKRSALETQQQSVPATQDQVGS